MRAVFADGSRGHRLTCSSAATACTPPLRRIIDPAAPGPAYSGLINTGGYAPGVRVDTEPGSYEMIFGKQAFFGYAVAPDREVWWFANVPRRDEPARGEAHRHHQRPVAPPCLRSTPTTPGPRSR